MNIAILAAGAGGMYCGSCLRDNALATALKRLGHHVVLVPLYTPLRTDTPDVSHPEVFMGGVNAWLQYASGVFRHTPRAIDWLFDRPWLLNMAGKYGAQTSPAKIGPFILSILRGDEGPQVKELRRLVRFLKGDFKPDILSLPNAMFIGMAKMMRQELAVPVVVELTGEDIFLEAMADPHRTQAQAIIRQKAADVSRFVATSNYYAERMADYLAVPRSCITVVPPGIDKAHLKPVAATPDSRPPTVGYFARVCPEKGLDKLVDAFAILCKLPGMAGAKLRAAGYLGAAHQAWFEQLKQRIARDGLADAFTYLGEVDLQGKIEFMDSIDVLSVPAPYAEPKGIYLLEAMARGVPVVQPRSGAFPEIIEATAGGVLVDANDAQALAEALAEQLRDPQSRAQLGARGRDAVASRFTDEHMAQGMLSLFQELRA